MAKVVYCNGLCWNRGWKLLTQRGKLHAGVNVKKTLTE